MNWYAAHIVMYVKFKAGKQKQFPVWENIVLICARLEDAALKKAQEYGRIAEGDDDGQFRWGEHSSQWVFAGVRKLTECEVGDGRPAEGSEVSYTEFEMDSLEAVEKLVSGKPVQATFNDHYRSTTSKSTRRETVEKPQKRKRA